MEAQIGFSMEFAVVMQLAETLGVSPISRPGVWECQVDDQWKIYCNGHPAELSCSDADLKPIPGYHVLVTYHNKIASLIDPDEGFFVNYNGCTEEAFVAAVEQRIESERMKANPLESTSPVIVGDGEALLRETEGVAL